jgi:hypothetical protein
MKNLVKPLSFTILASILLLSTGCGAEPTDTAQPSPIPRVNADGEFDLRGAWRGDFGPVELQQEGNRVWGTYEFKEGQLEGTLEGNRLEFRWWEGAAGQPYDGAAENQRGDGYFIVAEDGRSLEGKWRIEGEETLDGEWTLFESTGVYVGGTWFSNFGMVELKQEGNRVWGTYEYEDGELEGNLEGNRLEFSWWEGARGKSYKRAKVSNRGVGYFIVADNEKSLHGEWRYERSKAWDGEWTLTADMPK